MSVNLLVMIKSTRVFWLMNLGLRSFGCCASSAPKSLALPLHRHKFGVAAGHPLCSPEYRPQHEGWAHTGENKSGAPAQPGGWVAANLPLANNTVTQHSSMLNLRAVFPSRRLVSQRQPHFPGWHGIDGRTL